MEKIISINELSKYRALMYDNKIIRIIYSFPQKILVERTIIRVGSLQVINRNEICDITRDGDFIYVKLKSGAVIELQLETK